MRAGRVGLLAGLLSSTSVVSVPSTGSDVIVGEAEVCRWVGDELRTGGVNDSSSENIVGKGNCGSSSISDSSPELASSSNTL